MNDVKTLVRIADSVREALAGLKHNRHLEQMRRLTSFAGQLQELAAESRKMGMALTRGWLKATKRCGDKAVRLLGDLSYSISQVQQLTGGPKKEIPQLSTMVDELNELQREFGGLDFGRAENAIAVVTEPITLEDVYLGPFQIQLELNRLGALYRASSLSSLHLWV